MGSVARPSAAFGSTEDVVAAVVDASFTLELASESHGPAIGAGWSVPPHSVWNEYACIEGAKPMRPMTCASRNWFASVLIGCHCHDGFCAFEWPMSPNTICTG